ncbi:pectinesterase [Ricinus communis]|uniref:Pectinesterase n=1 Tax=Ricinus communis TaxID=3988 RepID=B9RR27_RICCO|nr:pectinesterase [Ricinus communis]EEF46198.1 Pectinesterase-2 precursor, putative [Ricinus communis]|eukprot:XP_002516196.1 pectinesterase [Ricinus communis]
MLRFMIFWLLGSALAASSMDENLQIQEECSFTRYPSLCLQTLRGLRDDSVHIVSALVNKSISETKLPVSFFTSLTSQLGIQEAQYTQSTTDYCENLMKMSLKLLDKSLLALKQSPEKNKNDIQTWLSAALTYQQACKDSVDSLGLPTGGLTSQISRKMDYLSELVSNPLALVNRITGDHDNKLKKNSTRSRYLGEEIQDFPKWVSAKDRKLLQSSTIKANAVVAKDGTGNYETVSEAIKAAGGGRFVIYVKAGVYKEKIRTNKDGITLIGEGKYSTIIVGDDSVGDGSSMPGSATFTITGDGFIARDIGFQNAAGPQGEQALALYIASDHSVLYRCSIAGYQDTLYALSQRQFYRECDIYGTIDFIFGNAAAVFQNCYLVLRRPDHGSYNVILANGRSDPGQNTGFSVQNCRITASSDFSPVKHSYNSYLGRPWKQYSRSIIMESYIDDAISWKGWIEWPGAGSYSKSLYFAEYSNTGPGAGTSKRPNWPGFHVIGAEEAVKFTVGKFISGSSWLPSTGVTFISGLQ